MRWQCGVADRLTPCSAPVTLRAGHSPVPPADLFDAGSDEVADRLNKPGRPDTP